MFEFRLADKTQTERWLPDLFRMLHANMSVIAPTEHSYDEDYELWRASILPAIQNADRHIVLMYAENKHVGYFQYSLNGATRSLMMEEIQIIKEFQGTGIFSALYKWLIESLPKDVTYVEAYAHKRNIKSQGILNRLGLVAIGENENGNSLHYQGEYAHLLKKYGQRLRFITSFKNRGDA